MKLSSHHKKKKVVLLKMARFRNPNPRPICVQSALEYDRHLIGVQPPIERHRFQMHTDVPRIKSGA